MDPDTRDLQLQQELQRFTTQFSDRIGDVMAPLQVSPRRDVRDAALKQALMYVSSALEIATGSAPEINLLDMFVFVRLSRSVVDHHWVPNLYGDAGRALAEALARSDAEITSIAEDHLGRPRAAQLARLVEDWLADNPGQTVVEGVRLGNFAVQAGAASADRALEAKGLLSSVRTATRGANEAMQLVDRTMFVVHRLPFLWRLQVRLGVREILGDVAAVGRGIARSGWTVAGVVGGGALLFLLLRGRKA
jgi:hypothetical protein